MSRKRTYPCEEGPIARSPADIAADASLLEEINACKKKLAEITADLQKQIDAAEEKLHERHGSTIRDFLHLIDKHSGSFNRHGCFSNGTCRLEFGVSTGCG